MKKLIILSLLASVCTTWLTAEVVVPMTDANYKQQLKEHNQTYLLFTAPWCGACRQMKPIYKAYASEKKGAVLFAQINTDENEKISSAYKIEALPTLVMVQGGKEIKRSVGSLDMEDLTLFVDTQKVLKSYSDKCDQNDAKSCLKLGELYDDSELLKSDSTKALKFYEKACSLKNAEACMYIGYRYDEGEGVKKDYVKALKYYTKGCEGNNTISCRFLAYMYDTGHGTKQNYKKAFNLYMGSCDDEDEYACNNLGYMYEAGHGLSKDLKKAKHFYELGCKYGYDEACDDVKRLNKK